MTIAPDLARARQSLDGLSVGDAFGERMFSVWWLGDQPARLPPGPWSWTDDTHMALSIVEVLERFGRIDQDALASAFVRRFAEEPLRGYAGGAIRLLQEIEAGTPWRIAARSLFDGGSYGNGGAMRAAPIGACFWRDPAVAVEQAQLSAVITHAHPEGQAGAMAVAAAAAIAARPDPPGGVDFLRAALPFIPESQTRERILASLDIPGDALDEALGRLGAGENVTAHDTVPFCLWCAAYRLQDFAGAMWWAVRESADKDTTCAIVGGIVASSAAGTPDEWLQRREPLTSP
jgi:ADP-ribosylglycohydrolase